MSDFENLKNAKLSDFEAVFKRIDRLPYTKYESEHLDTLEALERHLELISSNLAMNNALQRQRIVIEKDNQQIEKDKVNALKRIADELQSTRRGYVV